MWDKRYSVGNKRETRCFRNLEFVEKLVANKADRMVSALWRVRIPDRGRNKSKATFWQLNCDVILWTVVNVTNNILPLAVRLPNQPNLAFSTAYEIQF